MYTIFRATPLLLFALVLSAQAPPPQPAGSPNSSPAPTANPTVAPHSVNSPDVIPPDPVTSDVIPPDTLQPAGQTSNAAPVELPPASGAPTNGPGVLSRPFTITPLENQNIQFRPFFTLAGLTDSGLTHLTTETGQIGSVQSYGLQAGFGISGRRTRKKDVIELEFRGDVYRYTPNSVFDGGNYLLNLTYQHYFSSRVSIALTESAALYSNNYSLLNSLADLSVGGAQTAVTPNTQIFDNLTLSLSTGADVVIQQTSRLSFDFGGTGFLVRRESSSLYGTIGSQARADTTYRLTRRVTIGAYYAFSHYDFDRAFGGSDVETGGGIMSLILARGLELRLRGGISNVQTAGIESVPLDPSIAAILGVTEGRIVVRRTNVVPDVSAQLFKNFKLATGSIQYVESVTPGNGLYLTSRHSAISGYYNYTGIRRWTFSAGAGRDTLSTLGILVGRYSSNTARIGVDRMLAGGFQVTAYSEFRRYDVSEVNFLRNAYRINLGLAWTPSERPLKLW